jgi:flavin-dependent dehydrogenase
VDSAPRVAIAGGGPAGAVAALVLARRGVRAVVLEAHTAPEQKVGETLPPSLAPLLRHLGLDRLLEQDGHLRSQGNRALWGSVDPAEPAKPAETAFLANPYGEGWHVDRRRFEARLAEAAAATGAEWRWGCRLESCTAAVQSQGWHLEISGTSGTETLQVDFVADATGRPSILARRLGARRLRYDRLVGISALLESSTPAADTYTLVEAVPEGWWYSALLADGRLAVALLGDGDLLDRRLLGPGSDPGIWGERLKETTVTREQVEAHGYKIGASLRVLPADSSRLDAITGDGWLALGDAAAAYDPLSSHGVASAMGSGFYGGNAIADLLLGDEETTGLANAAYLDVMQKAYGSYLDLLREHYARERRWPETPFWRRRLAVEFGVEVL